MRIADITIDSRHQYADGRSYRYVSIMGKPADVLDHIKDRWIECEAAVGKEIASPFLSWVYIDAWLSSLPEDIEVASIYAVLDKPHNVWDRHAVAILVGGVKDKIWYPLRTGIERFDQVWPEYLGWLSFKENPLRVYADAYKHLLASMGLLGSHWAMTEMNEETDLWRSYLEYNSFVEMTHQEKGYIAPLPWVPELSKSKSFQTSLKVNERKISDQGWVFECLDKEVASETLQQAKIWHIDKWKNTNTPSGFVNEHFNQVHNSWINNSERGIGPCLFSARDNKGELLGVLYCIKTAKTMMFYLGSFKPQDKSSIKVGLWMHQKAMAWAHANGLLFYDFMCGEADYKRKFTCFSNEYTSFTSYELVPRNYLRILKIKLKALIKKVILLIKDKKKSD